MPRLTPQRGRPLAAFAGTPRPGRAPRRAAGGRRLAGRRPYPHAGCAHPAPAPQARPHRPHRDRVQGRLPPGGLTKQKRKNRRPAAIPKAADAGFLKHVCRPGETGAGPVENCNPHPAAPPSVGADSISARPAPPQPPRADIESAPATGHRARTPCRGRCSHRPAAPSGQPTSPGKQKPPPRSGLRLTRRPARSRARTRAGYPGRPA